MLENVIQCKEYIKVRLGRSIDSDALKELVGHEAACDDMKILPLSDPKEYHTIAQALHIKKISKKHNIYFKIKLPNNSRMAIILDSGKVQDFEDEYGAHYEISVVRDRPGEIKKLSEQENYVTDIRHIGRFE